MASTLSASSQGLEIVDRERKHKGWNKAELVWQTRADVSKSTLDRFWMQKPIKHQNFVAICEAVGVDWEKIVDLPAIKPTNITRKSNLAQVNHPVILELEEFGQQIFDWFGALDFKFEGLPRRESNYVEWVIQVPVRRSRFDRVLIRATIHEAGLSDMDSLRRGVAQLRVDEGWLVTNLWVSQSVRQALIKSDDQNLTCLTFDELIDQDADFTPYFGWLKAEINKIEKFYVPLNCRKGEFDPTTRQLRSSIDEDISKDDIDFYIDRWLANPTTEHVSILGEFGTGKTWFTLHYAWKCLQAYQIAKDKGLPRPRLPLVIRLRDYAKSLDVSNVMAGFFFNQHNIKLNHGVFDRLNQMGKLLLIFDGFDEMADKVDRQKMGENFRELVKVITPNSKVVLTCRTEHFDTAQAAIDNLHEVQIKFETLELVKFDDEQIRAVLSRRTTNPATVKLVMANSQLLDLLRRAVMAEFVLEALPEIEAGKPIDLTRVYLYAVRHKMERDITTGRTFTSLADKLYFLCELSWEMLSKDKTKGLNYREFPDKLRLLFGKEVELQKHLDHWHYDMMGQTMLIRNDDGDYSPAHRSLLEFFVAYKFAAELGLLADDFLELAQNQSGLDESLPPKFYTWSDYWRREVEYQDDHNCVRKLIAPLAGFKPESSAKLRETFGKSPLTRAILDLHLPAINLKVKYRESNSLIDLIRTTKATEVEYSGGNAATILVDLESNALEYQNLSGTNLAYANLVNAGLRGTDLSGANLENCLITRVFGAPTAIVMGKDDRQFITAHDDNTIRIWDRFSGRELQRLTGHQTGVNCLALSGNGQRLYSGSDDGMIREWELAGGTCTHTFKGHQTGVNCLALSGDGQRLYSGSTDRTIKEWEMAGGTCTRTFKGHQTGVNCLALSGDGQRLYSGSADRTIKEWEMAGGNCTRTFKGHQTGVNCLALSGDGQRLYSGSADRTIKEWEMAGGTCIRTFQEHQGSVMAIALSGDGQRLYSGSTDRTIKEWEMAGGNCTRTFKGHQGLVSAIALSEDGLRLYSGSTDRTIKEWEMAGGNCTRTFKGHEDWVSTIALSGDGQRLYSGSADRTIKEWEMAGGTCIRTFQGHQGSVMAIALSGDGQRLYSGSDDGMIREWELAGGTCTRTFQGHEDWVRAIALSGDELRLYSGSADRTIKEWEMAGGTCTRTFQGHQGSVMAIALSGDGLRLYSVSVDGMMKEWELAGGNCTRTFKGHQGLVSAIALSGDGQWLYSGSIDGMIREWELATGQCVRSINHRLCAGANITNAKGLTSTQTATLIELGAIGD
jgi:WD40 repeat protein